MRKSLQSRLLIIGWICMLGCIVLTGAVSAQENLTAEDTVKVSPSTGHAYEYVETDGVTWEEARRAAANRSHDGKRGYLVTITSPGEQEVVSSLTDKRAWIGASDARSEGTWRWITGPEGKEADGKGRHFFTQSDSGGSAIGGSYENWDEGEPNDVGGEDYAQTWTSDGKWNDNDKTSLFDGYIVEYGGMSDETEIKTLPSTGHAYEYVDTSSDITWEKAREAAAERSYEGQEGYLVTITSEKENDLVNSLIDKNSAWIGASDARSEGTWRWVTGPEGKEDDGVGRHFFTQTSSRDGFEYDGETPGGGFAVDDNYANWSSTEPNNLDDEDYAEIYSSGDWNDNDAPQGGYVVEYGGMSDERATPNFTIKPDTIPTNIVRDNSYTVSATVANEGDAAGTRDVKYEFQQGDAGFSEVELIKEDIELDAGESQEVAFTLGTETTDGLVIDDNYAHFFETADDDLTIEDVVVREALGRPELDKYTEEDGFVDSEGLLDAGSDFRNGEIDAETLNEVASAFRSGEPL
jgi:hypothetical protein